MDWFLKALGDAAGRRVCWAVVKATVGHQPVVHACWSILVRLWRWTLSWLYGIVCIFLFLSSQCEMCDIFFSRCHFWNIQCFLSLGQLYRFNIHIVKKSKWITTFISLSALLLAKFVKKINWFPCVCLWQHRCERWRNHVTFIFPLNLEHGSLPCRIQNWSLTFPLVPSLAWSHFLSIWFLAPYATFLFPACRQQGVALLSPS